LGRTAITAEEYQNTQKGDESRQQTIYIYGANYKHENSRCHGTILTYFQQIKGYDFNHNPFG
jgi:hypothetical protein